MCVCVCIYIYIPHPLSTPSPLCLSLLLLCVCVSLSPPPPLPPPPPTPLSHLPSHFPPPFVYPPLCESLPPPVSLLSPICVCVLWPCPPPPPPTHLSVQWCMMTAYPHVPESCFDKWWENFSALTSIKLHKQRDLIHSALLTSPAHLTKGQQQRCYSPVITSTWFAGWCMRHVQDW